MRRSVAVPPDLSMKANDDGQKLRLSFDFLGLR